MPAEKSSKPKKQKGTPTSASDFAVLPLALPSLDGVPEIYADAKHFLYVKQHEPSQPTASAERSLFVANVPVDATEGSIRALFADQLGGSRVEDVEFDSSVPAAQTHKRWRTASQPAGGEARGKKRKRDEDIVAEGVIEDEDSALPKLWNGELRRGGGCAIVKFVDAGSAKGALKEVKKAVKEGRVVRWTGGEGLGVQRYKTHLMLRYPSKSALQASINAYLGQFNAAEAARNRVRKHQRSVPDEDGFITVTRGGRSGPARLEEAEKKKAELEERRKKNGVKDDFYRFQHREKRKEEEMRLKKNFEADRRRVQEMRERRGKLRPES
ncbi:hypothetical protein BS50DRAFT_370293 [Corynespora cassiicola Philippines]|uniref:RRM domain-containing protein n=1 Tax=Corynespora cassiicola Philippines TaxID=1448308 RepID=A0A2T2NMI5_CORCC|nr:hypothetical protein BS50DRAFT_370293 [Corynespora cassiicola Philippines]